MKSVQQLLKTAALLGIFVFGFRETIAALEPNPGSPGAPPPGVTPDAPRTPAPSQTTRIIVKYRVNAQARVSPQAAAEAAQALSQRAGVSLRPLRATAGDAQVLVIEGPPRSEDEVRAIAERIAQDPDVEYAEPDAIMRIQQVDPRLSEQWHYNQAGVGINLAQAWQNANGSGVIVAVIDTGFRPHADLAAHVLPGFDFIADVPTANDGDGRDADATDPGDWTDSSCPTGARDSSWHGTHVAGTVAAITNNGVGVAGIAPDARILPVRVLGVCGGFLSDITDGMRWAVGLPVPGVPNNANGARVLNLSLGGGGACGPTYADAISAVRQQGATIAVAAGNSNSDASGFRPANCDGVITVAATNRQGGRAFYSNFGSVVEIAAPGGETNPNLSDGVLSTLNTGTTSSGADSYQFYQGTSMATPHVAGVAALLYSAKPTITPDEVLAVLQRTAQPFPATSTRPCNTATCGAGIVNAGAAVIDVTGGGSGVSACSLCYSCGASWPAFSGAVPLQAGSRPIERGSICSGTLSARPDSAPFLCCRQ
jgi:serine protease